MKIPTGFLNKIENIEMQTLKELRAASCEHSCVKRMVFGSSNEPELIPLSDKDVAKNWDTLEMILNQHVKCSVSDDALTLKINLNSDAAPNTEKMPARSSCVHSCMEVQDQVEDLKIGEIPLSQFEDVEFQITANPTVRMEIQSLHKEIDRLKKELSGQIAYKEQNRLVIQERNKTIQERDQEIDRLKGRVEVRERDLGVMSQDYLTAVLALQESKGPVGQTYRETIQQLHTGIQGHVKTIQERDAEIQRLKSQVEALKYEARIAKLNLKAGEKVILGRGETIQNQCTEIQRLKNRVEALERDIGVMSQDCWTAVLALQEVDQAQKETIQNQCIEIQRMKGRLYVFENTPFDNWVKRAEKAEVELEKIKEYARRWTEAKCEDPNCEFCSKRPEKPLN
ncbi:MAG: hypothetical protein PHP56_12565 [Smithellaceae bacterium]|nr:hypothetical protein [Smithellaceae bacterium]